MADSVIASATDPGVRSIRTQTGHDVHAFEVHYREDDEIIREIRTTGFYDRYVIAQFDARPGLFKLGPGAVCIDVGANLGLYALYLARKVGPSGRVIAFEGNADTAALLRLNAKVNELDNIAVETTILAGAEQAMVEITTEGSGQSEFRPASDGGRNSVTLDAYAGDLERADFLKIDVNGLDFAILLAGRDMLKRFRPAILIEFVPAEIDPETLGACFKLLRELGYQPMFFRGHWYSALEICSYPVLVGLYQDWRTYSPGSWMNLAFIPQENLTAR